MKKILKIITVFLLLTSNSNSEVSQKLSEYISNIIPGEGHTEASIDLRENNKPDFSILAVRELKKNDNGNYFSQLSLFSTEKENDDRIVGNLGLGKRTLSEDKLLMTGLNAFFDFDDHGNIRSSLGVEVRNAVLELTYNQYKKLAEGTGERVLDGYDLRLASQIPYFHWANAFINAYSWDGVDRDDVDGKILGSEFLLNPNFNLELGYDDKDKAGVEDEWYAKLMFFHPPREGATLQDGMMSDEIWTKEKDMTGELLTKVNRNNKIMVEFKGTSTISRTD